MSDEAGKLSKLGIELGSGTYGDPSAAFTHGLLVSEFKCNPKIDVKPAAVVDGTMQVRKVTRPPIKMDFGMKFPLDLGDNASANIGQLLAGILGDDAISGSGPYLHTLTRLDSSTPPWFNFWSDKDVDDKQYKGARFGQVKFNLKGGDGQIDVEASGIVKEDAELAGPQALVFSGSPLVVPSQASTLTLGGAPVTNFDGLSIAFTRELEGFHPVGNSRYAGKILAKGPLLIELTAEGLDFAAETERDKFIAGTSSAFNLILTDSLANYLRFNFPEIYHTAWEGPDISEGDLKRVSMAGLVTANTYAVLLSNLRSTAYDA
jgi:hypothetical protein